MNTTNTAGAVVPRSAADALTFSEATVQDLQLAKALGFERPTNIRNLIRRHLPNLKAMGLVLQREASIVSGKGRIGTVTEYHLNKAQAAFIIAKAKTKRAESLAILMAEVFAMFTERQLVPVDDRAAKALQAAEEREKRRREHEDDKIARRRAFKLIAAGRTSRRH